MYFLVDYENMTGSYPFDGAEFLSEKDTLIIFFSQCASTIRSGDLKKIENSGCQIKLVSLVKQRKNGLDFYIASYIGKLFGCNNTDEAVIITGDTGLQAVSDYWKANWGGKYSVIVSKNIMDAICQSKHDSGIKEEVTKFNNRVNLEFEVCQIKYRRKAKLLFVNLLENTGFEDEIDEILRVYEISKTSKNRYNEFLKAFGRAKGGKIYSIIKGQYSNT